MRPAASTCQTRPPCATPTIGYAASTTAFHPSRPPTSCQATFGPEAEHAGVAALALLGQPPDHRLGIRLPIQPHRAGTHLVGVLLRCFHERVLPWQSDHDQKPP